MFFWTFVHFVCPDFIACLSQKNLRVICYIIPFFQRTSRFILQHCFSLKRAAKIQPFLIRSANFLSFFSFYLLLIDYQHEKITVIPFFIPFLYLELSFYVKNWKYFDSKMEHFLHLLQNIAIFLHSWICKKMFFLLGFSEF